MSKKSLLALLLLTLTFPLSSFSSDERDITKHEEFEKCEFVFIGEITKVEEWYVSILPYEMFKGERKQIITAVNFPTWQYAPQGYAYFDSSEVGDKWLFYAYSVSNDTVYISPQSWSRNLYNPRVVPPPPSMDQISSINYLINEVADLSAKVELQMDFKVLGYKAEQLEKDEEKPKPDYSMLYFSIISVLLLILIILNIVIIRKVYRRNKGVRSENP